MYQIELTEAYCPPQTGPELLPYTIGEALELAEKEAGDKNALTEVCLDGSIGRRWRYRELYQTSLKLAHQLAARYPKGTRVAVCAHNIPEWIFLEYATALAGLVLVTVNPSFQRDEVSYIVAQSGAEALFYVPEFRGNPIEEIVRDVQKEHLHLKDLVNMLDTEAFFGSPIAEPSLPAVSPEDPFQIQYTSGTTGFPKGAVLGHRALLNTNYLIGDRAGVHGEDVYINFLPLFHTGGCAVAVLGVLTARACMVLAPKFDPTVINDIIEKERVSALLAVPAMLQALLEELSVSKHDHSTIEKVVCGGAMVSPTLIAQAEQYWDCRPQVIFGQTECSPVATMTQKDDSIADQTTTVGQPLPHVEVSVRSPNDNSVMPLSTVGEVCVRGFSLMLEYNNNPEATAKAIDAEGWLHTGDLGSMDARGFLKISGRIKEMIIRGGENLFPVEIENAMVSHPSIAEVAVVGVPDEKWGENVCCFYRLEEDSEDLSVEVLRGYAREKLSAQKTPYYWVRVNEWPMTQSGKIQKFQLQEDIGKGSYNLRSS